MHIEQFDPRLDSIIDSRSAVETVVEGSDLGVVPDNTLDFGASLESPLWWEEGQFLIFSDVASGRIMRWSDSDGLSVFLEPSGHANGLWRDRQGRLLLCEHSGRQVTRIEQDGSRTTVMRSYRGQRLNRPNTVVVASDGGMWFTDYKFRTGATEDWDVDFEGVYHVSPDLGTKTLVLRDLYRPHKLLLSTDERTLYVGQHEGILAFDRIATVRGKPVESDRTDGGRVDMDSRRWFWRAGEHGSPEPDGMKIDTEGNMYVAGRQGLWFISAEGDLLGHLDTDGLSTPNLAFGGADARTLYFVGNHAVFRVPVRIPGMPCRPPSRDAA